MQGLLSSSSFEDFHFKNDMDTDEENQAPTVSPDKEAQEPHAETTLTRSSTAANLMRYTKETKASKAATKQKSTLADKTPSSRPTPRTNVHFF
jgi:hypothetical protein